MKIVVFLGLCASFLAGCAGIDKVMTGKNTAPSADARKELVSSFPEFTQKQREQFIEGTPWIGMTQKQLNAMWGGEPKKRQSKLTSTGSEETQIYAVRVGDWKTGISDKYFKVKMADGKLTEFQELDENVGSFDKL